ncbi:MAG TPA: amidohydrolase [Vicinamibacterales bacterium]|jgi:amidohydrolase
MTTSLAVIVFMVVAATVVGLVGRGRGEMNLERWSVGGRRFGVLLVWLLMAGGVVVVSLIWSRHDPFLGLNAGFVALAVNVILTVSSPMTADLNRDIDALAPSLVDWRRDFHRHPELAFQEHRTSAVIRTFLEGCGIDVRACGGTGLRGVLTGGMPGPTVALRADMDGLPVAEENEHDYRSATPGTMHACGHDGHMAILMGAATTLAAHRASLAGTVVFLFQPSEENPPGGARRMIDEGALEGVDRVFGLHLWQPLPTGLVGLCKGAMMAQSDTFEVVITGRGGHASQPHLTIDPVLVASHIVVAAQSIASRSVDPLQAVVVSFTTVHGGTVHNIIPNTVTLTGTVRTLDLAVQRLARQRLQEVCERTAQVFGATAAFTYVEGYPPLVNDGRMVDLVGRVALREFGDQQVATMLPVMGGEDFAYYLQHVQGAFVMLGTGTDRPYPHHNARFDLDERVLPIGVSLMTRVALEMLATSQ